MADPRLSGRSGGGDPRLRGRTGSLGKPDAKKDRDRGFWGQVARPFVNTGRAVYGLGPGIYETAKAVGTDVARHPGEIALLASPLGFAIRQAIDPTNPFPETYRKVVKPIGQSYAWKYGSGDWKKTLTRALVEDPLGTAIDVGVLATGGTAAAVKAGFLPAAARSVTLRSPGALAGQEAKVIKKGITGSELSRQLRVGADQALKRLPPEFAVLGENARFTRMLRVREGRTLLTNVLKRVPFAKSAQKLSKEETVAANLLHDYPVRAELEQYKASLAGKPEAAPVLELLASPKVNALFDAPTPRMRAYLAESAKLGDEAARLAKLSPKTVEARRFQQMLILRGARVEKVPGGGYELTAPEGTTIPAMIARARAELGGAEPLYRKHVSVEERRGVRVAHGGGAPQKARPPVYQSRALLAAAGRVAYDVDSLTPVYMKQVQYAHYVDRHADLIASGVEVPRGYRLAEGEEFLKRTTSEKIPYTERTAGEFERNIEDVLARENPFTTTDELGALETERGTRIVIPSKMREQIVGEYRKGHKAVEWFFTKPTTVWRALVLNLRVGWLVNNMVGNTLLYTVKSAGPNGLRAYLQAVTDIHGVRVALRLTDDAKITNRLTPVDMALVLPEQVAGTFMGTQVPTGKFGRTRVGRVVTAAPRVLRHVDIAYEQALRRAIANRVLRRSPEVRARLQAMPKETRTWRAAMRQELEANPTLVDRVSSEIHNALGNFRNLSSLEQSVLRQAAPFYAWYRAITMIMVKLPFDNPARASILYNLGKLGIEYEQSFGKPGLEGAIGLGNNKVLRTQGLNPWATVPQVGESLRTIGQAFIGDIPGTGIKRVDPYRLAFELGILNPYLTAVARPGGIWRTARYLPETRFMFPPSSKQYTDAGYLAEALQYLGVPIRKVRP